YESEVVDCPGVARGVWRSRYEGQGTAGTSEINYGGGGRGNVRRSRHYGRAARPVSGNESHSGVRARRSCDGRLSGSDPAGGGFGRGEGIRGERRAFGRDLGGGAAGR